MEENDHPSINSCLNIDILEEIDAVKAIYEDQITSNIDNNAANVTFSDANIMVTFNINSKY